MIRSASRPFLPSTTSTRTRWPGSRVFKRLRRSADDMNKDVLAAAIGRDEAVALLGPEPFHRPFERLRRARGPAVEAASARRRATAVLASMLRTLVTSGPLAPAPISQVIERALANIVIAGAAQDRHRQKRVLRAVGHRDKAEPFAGIEPFDRRIDAAAGGGGHLRRGRMPGRRSYMGPLNVR